MANTNCGRPRSDRLQTNQRRDDFTPDEMKEGKVLYFEQVDNLSGKDIYRMHFAAASTDRVVIDVENAEYAALSLHNCLAPG